MSSCVLLSRIVASASAMVKSSHIRINRKKHFILEEFGMRSKFFGVVIVILLIQTGIFVAIAKYEKTKIVSFNRLSLEIPDDWKYSTNPQAVPGTDQIQLYSADRNRTLLITLTNARDDISLQDAVMQGGRMLVGRAVSVPEFRNCMVEGSGDGPSLWGREGIVTHFNLIKESESGEKTVVMKIYNMGENLSETKEVLFIAAFIVGEEKPDTESIVRSLKILEKKSSDE
jgi:hypothetical protein